MHEVNAWNNLNDMKLQQYEVLKLRKKVSGEMFVLKFLGQKVSKSGFQALIKMNAWNFPNILHEVTAV